jgi:hypothetical protein
MTDESAMQALPGLASGLSVHPMHETTAEQTNGTRAASDFCPRRSFQPSGARATGRGRERPGDPCDHGSMAERSSTNDEEPRDPSEQARDEQLTLGTEGSPELPAQPMQQTDVPGDEPDEAPGGETDEAPGGQPDEGPDEAGIDPRETPYELLQRGHALLEHRHPAQAAIVLERADRAEPGKASIIEALARAYYNSGQHERARAAFEQLLQIDPSAHYGHYGLAQSLKKLGRREEAGTHLRLAVALDPSSSLYRAALGRLGPDAAKGPRRETDTTKPMTEPTGDDRVDGGPDPAS